MRVYGYVRVSTDRQDLERQRKQITEFCELKNYELQHIYSEKISGAADIDQREELSMLMQKTGADADLVVISEMSRYSRQDDLVEVVYSITKLLKRGLSLIFLDNKEKIYEANTTLSIEDIILLIAKAFANAEERKKIFERMYGRKIQLLEKNHYTLIGKSIPFGFRAVPNPKYDAKKKNGEPKTFLEEDEYEREIIIELFRRSAEGETYRELQKFFNEHNKRPLLNNKRRKAKYGDLPRQSLTVAEILTNTIYCGKRIHNVRDFNTNISSPRVFEIKPMVSEETFNKSLNAHKKNGLIIDKTHICANPLKGIIKCYCGSSMVLATKGKKKYYSCFKSKKASKLIADKWCGNYGISQELLIDIVNYDIQHGLNERLREKYDKATSDKLQEISTQLKHYKSEYDKLNAKQIKRKSDSENLYNAIKDTTNDIVRKRIVQLQDELVNEIEESEIQLKELDNKIQSLKEYERITLRHNQNQIVTDCNSDEYSKYLQSIIQRVIYRGYDVINGLVVIIYLNGFISYYAVRKRRSWRFHDSTFDAEIIPLSDEYIKYDNKGRVILNKNDNEPIEVDSVDKVRELVKAGEQVTIYGTKIRAFNQRFINL